MKELKPNFIYPKITPGHYRFGSQKFASVPLREDGDWRNYLPPEEEQFRNGIEQSDCYIQASQHAIATIQEEQYWDTDNNYSSRFNALLSDGREYGGDPLVGGDSMRNDGLIPEEAMLFSDMIKSWNDYHSWLGVDETHCRALGKVFLSKWKLNYDIVFERDEPSEQKFAKLREALNYSPCPISVYGMLDENGDYVQKQIGDRDTHLVLAVYLDSDNCIWVFDTYKKFLKKLPKNYNSNFCMRWSVSKQLPVVEVKKKWWQLLWEWFFREKLIYRAFKIFNIKYEKFNKMAR